MTDDKSDSSSTSILIGVLGGIVLVYIAGAFTAFFGLFPYQYIAGPLFSSLTSPLEQGNYPARPPGGPAAWQPTAFSTQTESDGVVQGEASSGLTFYTSGHRAGAFLIDEGGRTVYEWHLPFDEVWSDPHHIAEPAPEAGIYWGEAHLYPDGSVAAIYTAPGQRVSGYGLVKADRQSSLVWSVDERIHSDLAVAPNGAIFALSHELRSATDVPVARPNSSVSKLLVDSVVRVSEEGEIQRKFSLVDALANTSFHALLAMYPQLADTPAEKRGEVLGASGIEIIGSEFASHHEFAEPGDLLVVLRSLDAVAVIDRRRQRVEWATRGMWWHPSDVELLSNGHMLVFDQDGHGGPGLASRVLEFDPATEAVVWAYGGDDSAPLWTQEGGEQQQLPNGHVLITSSMSGQLLEVSRTGKVTWKYRNPARRQTERGPMIGTIWAGHRVARERLEFLPAEALR